MLLSGSQSLLLLTCLFIVDTAKANNLHDQGIRSVVAPLLQSIAALPPQKSSKAGLRLTLNTNKDLPQRISYRFEQLKNHSPVIHPEVKGLVSGIYEIVILVDGRESFRSRVIALPNLVTDLTVTYNKKSGFFVAQTLALAPIKFIKSKKEIRNESLPVLESLAKVLREFRAIASLNIEVHTDSGGEERSNLELTGARAVEISDFLRTKGIEQKRLHPLGRGSSLPLPGGNAAEAKLKNRRTEFIVVQLDENVLFGKSH